MMKRSMITNQALINQSKPGRGDEPTNTQRRTLIGGALVALLSAPLLSAPRRVMAQCCARRFFRPPVEGSL